MDQTETAFLRILLADDHPLFVEALRALIERHIAASELTVVSDLDAAHRALMAGRFDLAILDLHMPGASGFEGVRRTLAQFPETPVAVISGSATAVDVKRAIELGAKGFLPKTLSPDVLAAALRVIAAGGTYVPTEYATGGGMAISAAGLTQREGEVLTLLMRGQSNKEIGRALELKEITVKLHVRNIFRKLKVRNRVEAVNAASRLGVVPVSGRR
jgi:DNA-binding NarL/FixJ family response regulator